MKSKKFLLALAVPMAFAACSNEEFIANNMAPTEGNLVELGDNFVLTGQQAAGSTRSIWESTTGGLKWSWLPDPTATAELNSQLGTGTPLEVKADEIGLCWTGELPNGTGNIGSNVYTNYQFLHNGWLAEDQDVADLDFCTGELKNGKLYADITTDALSASSEQDDVKTQLLDASNQVNGKNLNLNTGVFKTDNKAIFGGSYIVYYPYNEDFADAGTLPVKSETNFTDVAISTDNSSVSAAHVAKNTVLVGYAKDLIGGSQASKFSMNPLSGIISLQISQEGTAKTIEKVALWSEDGFVTNVNLDAAKIKANGANGGEALYVEGTKQTKSTIVAELETPQALLATAVKVYLPVLPTTAKDLKVILYTANEVAVISTGKDYTIGAAQGVIVEAKAKEADFKDTKIAVDAATLADAVSTAGTEDEPVNVTVIGDIRLNKDVITSGNLNIAEYVTVNGGKIIVEPGFTLTLKNKSTVLSDIDVEGQDCCTTENAGQLSLASATVGGEINILAGYNTDKQDGKMTIIQNNIVTVKETATINNYGEVEVGAATATSQTLVNLSGTINNYGELTILKSTASGSSVSVDKDAKIAVLANGHFNNKANGSTTVEGVLAVYPGDASNEGVIYDKVSSQITGNIADLSGDYICEVDNNGNRFSAALNERPTTIIKFVNTGNYDMDKIKSSVRENKIEKYVVAATGVIFKGSKTNAVEQTIKNLEVEKGADLKVTTKSLHLTVTGNVDIAGKMTLDESSERDDVVFNAGTVNVKYNKEESIFGKLEIGNSVRSELGTLNIEGTNSNTASATNSGSATFDVNSVTTASVAIINKGYALITLASGTDADVSAFVFYTEDAAKPSGNGVWANGVPTPEIEY